MKKIILILVVAFGVNYANAQNKTGNSNNYKTGVGLRLGGANGLNLKTFIDEKTAVEIIGFFNSDGTTITGLYEKHGELSTEGNVKWYYGGGANIGLYKSSTVIGLSGVLGVDYKFKKLPIDAAIDWMPSFQFNKDYGFRSSWVSLAARYTF